MILGIDAGGSALKLAALENGTLSFSYCADYGGKPLRELIPQGCDRIALTGVNSLTCGAQELGIAVTHIPELQAIGRGGTYLTGKERALVVSVGTGTAFILADHGQYTHLGGSGLGGGSLCGLGQKLFGTDDAAFLDGLAMQGDLDRVDLTIGDLFSGSETLDPSLTAANLAKVKPDATDADWAMGMVNLILQPIGTMAMLACSGHKLDTVILTGAVAGLKSAKGVFHRFQEGYGIEYILPEQGRYATAIGAVLLAGE